jgi:hypothetical protein
MGDKALTTSLQKQVDVSLRLNTIETNHSFITVGARGMTRDEVRGRW